MKVKFDEIANFVAGQSPKSEFYSANEGIPFLQGNRTFGMFYPKIDTYTTKTTKIAHEGDILMSVRAPVGDLNFAPCELCIGRGLSAITAKNGDNAFLFYALKYNIQNLLNQSGGTTFDSVTGDVVRNMDMIIPEFSSHKKISELLYAIDGKIENNNKIISELESMAKTLYDYWFLQFEFPNEEGKPYKSSGGKMVWNKELKRDIPEGWSVKTLPEVANVKYGFPLSIKLFSEKGKPVIRIRDILDNSISAYTTEYVENDYLTKSEDLLIGMDGNFQINYWARNDDIVNQRITRIRKTFFPIMLIKEQIKPYIDAKVSNVARSTVGHLSDKDIKNLLIVVPNKDVDICVFDLLINKICSIKRENQQLTSLRDFLLPMLMNGQVTFTKEGESIA